MQLVGGAGHQRGVAMDDARQYKLWYVLKLLYSEETDASITGKATCDPNHHEKRSRGYFTVAYSPSECCCFTVRYSLDTRPYWPREEGAASRLWGPD